MNIFLGIGLPFSKFPQSSTRNWYSNSEQYTAGSAHVLAAMLASKHIL
jgi:hypothetical protein